MQATITYLLTEQAQRAQMAATGQPVARKQTIQIEVAAADLDLFPVNSDGLIVADLNDSWNSVRRTLELGGLTVDAPEKLSEIPAALRRGLAKRAELAQQEAELLIANGAHNRAQTDLAYAAFVADPSARGDGWSNGPRKLVTDVRSPADWWPEQHNLLVSEIERRNAADRAAAEAAKVAKEAEKQAYMDAWIVELTPEMLYVPLPGEPGSPNNLRTLRNAKDAEKQFKQQYADGLLCREIVTGLIADAAFAAVEVGPAFAWSTCRNSGCPCGKSELACIPRHTYTNWASIKAKLPEGYTVQFLDVRPCPGEDFYCTDDSYTIKSVVCAKISIPCGPFTFTRTIELDED